MKGLSDTLGRILSYQRAAQILIGLHGLRKVFTHDAAFFRTVHSDENLVLSIDYSESRNKLE